MTRKPLNLSVEYAAHALGLLVAEGKIAAKDVTSALERREQMIRDLKSKLATLETGAVAKDGPFPMAADTGRRMGRKARRRMSPARRAALKLHGQYLGHVRKLSATNRAKVKVIRQKSGVPAAISAAKRLGK